MPTRNIYGVYRASGAPLRKARRTRNGSFGTRSIYAKQAPKRRRVPKRKRTRRPNDRRPHSRRVR